MRITRPPIHPDVHVHPDLTNDPAHNRREFDACVAKAAELNCNIVVPNGEWPVDPPLPTDVKP